MRLSRKRASRVSREVKSDFPTMSINVMDVGSSCEDADLSMKPGRESTRRYEKANCMPSPGDLRKARENLNLTQEEIALLLGGRKSLVSKLEDGSRALSDELLRSYTNHIIPGGEDFHLFCQFCCGQGRISPDDRDRIVGKTGIENESRLSLRESMIIEAHEIPNRSMASRSFQEKH